MKRILALALSAALLLTLLCACTGGGPDATVIPTDPAEESTATLPADTTQEPSLALPSEEPSEKVPDPTEEVPTEPSPEPSAEPSQEPSQAPATQPPATQAPATQPPATQAPATQPPATQTPAPTPEPTLEPTPEPTPSVPGFGSVVIPGFGENTEPSQAPSDGPGKDPDGFIEPTGPSASDIDLEDFLWSVFDRYEFPGMDVLPDEWAANFYPGLLSIPVVQRLVCTPSMTGVAAEITLIQVTSGSDVSRVRSILEARKDAQIAGGAYYPAIIEQWERSCQIVVNGNYLMLVVNADSDAIVADFNALF